MQRQSPEPCNSPVKQLPAQPQLLCGGFGGVEQTVELPWISGLLCLYLLLFLLMFHLFPSSFCLNSYYYYFLSHYYFSSCFSSVSTMHIYIYLLQLLLFVLLCLLLKWFIFISFILLFILFFFSFSLYASSYASKARRRGNKQKKAGTQKDSAHKSRWLLSAFRGAVACSSPAGMLEHLVLLR